jgi:hypothetical protein
MKPTTRLSSKLLFVITIPLAGLLAAVLVMGAADQAGAHEPNIERFEAVLDTPALVTTQAVSLEELPPGWQTIFTTTFEGDFPADWAIMDLDPAGGTYAWGEYTGTNTTPGGTHSGWGVGAALAASPSLSDTGIYTDSVDAWMIAGPFDFTGAVDARLSFNAAFSTELGVDTFGWAASLDGQLFVGNHVSGGQEAWVAFEHDLRSFAGEPAVWIAFRFTSDDNGIVGWGPFVDDILLELKGPFFNFQPVTLRDWYPTPTPTPQPPVYEDFFDDPNSGWPNDSGPMYEDGGRLLGFWYRDYVNGEYRIKVEEVCPYCIRFRMPDALAPYEPPTDQYCIETSLRFEVGSYWANMGVVFGANEANTKFYALCLSQDTTDQLGMYLVRVDNYEFPIHGCYHADFSIEGLTKIGTDRYGWNNIQLGVNGDQVSVRVGGYDKGTFTMSGLAAMTRVGLLGGPAELPPTDLRASYFRVIPDAACTP